MSAIERVHVFGSVLKVLSPVRHGLLANCTLVFTSRAACGSCLPSLGGGVLARSGCADLDRGIEEALPSGHSPQSIGEVAGAGSSKVVAKCVPVRVLEDGHRRPFARWRKVRFETCVTIPLAVML